MNNRIERLDVNVAGVPWHSHFSSVRSSKLDVTAFNSNECATSHFFYLFHNVFVAKKPAQQRQPLVNRGVSINEEVDPAIARAKWMESPRETLPKHTARALRETLNKFSAFHSYSG